MARQSLLTPLAVSTALIAFASCATPPISSPEGTTTSFVESTKVLVYAPRAARAQKVVFDTDDKQLIYKPDTSFRQFFEAHRSDFAEGKVEYAQMTILEDVINMLRNKEYIRLMLKEVIDRHREEVLSPRDAADASDKVKAENKKKREANAELLINALHLELERENYPEMRDASIRRVVRVRDGVEEPEKDLRPSVFDADDYPKVWVLVSTTGTRVNPGVNELVFDLRAALTERRYFRGIIDRAVDKRLELFQSPSSRPIDQALGIFNAFINTNLNAAGRLDFRGFERSLWDSFLAFQRRENGGLLEIDDAQLDPFSREIRKDLVERLESNKSLEQAMLEAFDPRREIFLKDDESPGGAYLVVARNAWKDGLAADATLGARHRELRAPFTARQEAATNDRTAKRDTADKQAEYDAAVATARSRIPTLEALRSEFQSQVNAANDPGGVGREFESPKAAKDEVLAAPSEYSALEIAYALHQFAGDASSDWKAKPWEDVSTTREALRASLAEARRRIELLRDGVRSVGEGLPRDADAASRAFLDLRRASSPELSTATVDSHAANLQALIDEATKLTAKPDDAARRDALQKAKRLALLLDPRAKGIAGQAKAFNDRTTEAHGKLIAADLKASFDEVLAKRAALDEARARTDGPQGTEARLRAAQAAYNTRESAFLNELEEAIERVNGRLPPEARESTATLKPAARSRVKKALDDLARGTTTALSSLPDLIEAGLQRGEPGKSRNKRALAEAFAAVFNGYPELVSSDEPIFTALLKSGKFTFATDGLERTAFSSLPRAFEDEAKKHTEAAISAEGLRTIVRTAIRTADFAYLFGYQAINRDIVETFKREFHMAFKGRLSEALAEEKELDYDYWWITAFPKAIPTGTSSLAGQSIIEVSFPEKLVPQEQYHRWIQDHIVDSGKALKASRRRLQITTGILSDFLTVLDASELSERYPRVRQAILTAMAKFTDPQSPNDAQRFLEGLIYLNSTASSPESDSLLSIVDNGGGFFDGGNALHRIHQDYSEKPNLDADERWKFSAEQCRTVLRKYLDLESLEAQQVEELDKTLRFLRIRAKALRGQEILEGLFLTINQLDTLVNAYKLEKPYFSAPSVSRTLNEGLRILESTVEDIIPDPKSVRLRRNRYFQFREAVSKALAATKKFLAQDIEDLDGLRKTLKEFETKARELLNKEPYESIEITEFAASVGILRGKVETYKSIAEEWKYWSLRTRLVLEPFAEEIKRIENEDNSLVRFWMRNARASQRRRMGKNYWDSSRPKLARVMNDPKKALVEFLAWRAYLLKGKATLEAPIREVLKGFNKVVWASKIPKYLLGETGTGSGDSEWSAEPTEYGRVWLLEKIASECDESFSKLSPDTKKSLVESAKSQAQNLKERPAVILRGLGSLERDYLVESGVVNIGSASLAFNLSDADLEAVATEAADKVWKQLEFEFRERVEEEFLGNLYQDILDLRTLIIGLYDAASIRYRADDFIESVDRRLVDLKEKCSRKEISERDVGAFLQNLPCGEFNKPNQVQRSLASERFSVRHIIFAVLSAVENGVSLPYKVDLYASAYFDGSRRFSVSSGSSSVRSLGEFRHLTAQGLEISSYLGRKGVRTQQVQRAFDRFDVFIDKLQEGERSPANSAVASPVIGSVDRRQKLYEEVFKRLKASRRLTPGDLIDLSRFFAAYGELPPGDKRVLGGYLVGDLEYERGAQASPYLNYPELWLLELNLDQKREQLREIIVNVFATAYPSIPEPARVKSEFMKKQQRFYALIYDWLRPLWLDVQQLRGRNDQFNRLLVRRFLNEPIAGWTEYAGTDLKSRRAKLQEDTRSGSELDDAAVWKGVLLIKELLDISELKRAPLPEIPRYLYAARESIDRIVNRDDRGVLATLHVDRQDYLTPDARRFVVDTVKNSANMHYWLNEITKNQHLIDQLYSGLLDKLYRSLWDSLDRLGQSGQRFVPYKVLQRSDYENFKYWSKPSLQRGIQIVDLLPASRDDLVSISINEGGTIARAAGQAEGAAAYDVNRLKMAQRNAEVLSSTFGETLDRFSNLSEAQDQGAGTSSSQQSQGTSRSVQSADLNRLLSATSASQSGLGARGQGNIYSRARAAMAYARRREYLDAAITAAGRGDNFAKWVVRQSDVRSDLAGSDGDKLTAAAHNGYPNGDQPFHMLVKIPRSAIRTDWQGRRYILFNSSYSATMRRSFWKESGFLWFFAKAIPSIVNPNWWRDIEKAPIGTTYPFKWNVPLEGFAWPHSDSLKKQETLLSDTNVLGAKLYLDDTDKIKYSEVTTLIEAEKAFIKATREAQLADVNRVMNELVDESENFRETLNEELEQRREEQRTAFEREKNRRERQEDAAANQNGS